MFGIPERQVAASLEGLAARGFLAREGDSLDITGIFEKIADLWAEEKMEAFQEARAEVAATSGKSTRRPSFPLLGNLYSIFEQEFGRPLTPLECTQIVHWCKDEGYSEELIVEALRRAVLRGVFNLNYIDRILSRWARHNLRTPREVSAYEENFLAQRQKKGRAAGGGSKGEDREEKYKDLYM